MADHGQMTTKEAADYLGYSESALRSWRNGQKVWESGNEGPKFTSINGRIWYRRKWLDEWISLAWGKVRDDDADND